MLLGGAEAVFVDRRLLLCQKSSYETPHRGTSSHSTLVGFVWVGKWPWTLFFSRACSVSWLTYALLMFFPWSIVWNSRRCCFGRVCLGRMAQKRCHSGGTIQSFWFDSSSCLRVSFLRPYCSGLQANWRGSESRVDSHFPWPTAWSGWQPFLWLQILPLLLVSPQLCCPGNSLSRFLDRASQCPLFGRAALISWMGTDVTLAEIS